MAVSKIKAIKNTLKKAIDYIVNPDKTEDGSLVSSYGCSVPTADLEMSMTAQKGNQRGNRIAYHLMQAFSPEDDIMPEEAHRLGIEYAHKMLGNKYEFVIATHTDKDHIHNHIIFNATDYLYHKKYHYNYFERMRMRKENDKICRDNGLDVIENPSGIKGKSRYEYEQSLNENSWKDQLRNTIDEAVKRSNNFEGFLLFMEMEGYEIKRGKNIAFRASGQERFTRSKRIGNFYTEEMLQKRIENKELYQSNIKENISEEKAHKKNKKEFKNKKINLIVDISKNLKSMESPAYKRVVVKGNMNNLAETLNYLMKHNLRTTEQLEDKINEVFKTYNDSEKSLKDIEEQMQTLSEKIKFTQNYFKYGKEGRRAKCEPNNSEFLKENEQQILLFNAAEIYMNRKSVNVKELNLKAMFDEYKEVKIKYDILNKEKKSVQNIIKELRIIQSNIEMTLNVKLQVDTEKERQDRKKNKDKENEL